MIEPTDEMVQMAVDKFLDGPSGTIGEIDGSMRDALAAVFELVEQQFRRLLWDFVDPDPCWYDHHGYCQAHGWFETEPKCPHLRAKELL